MGKKELLMSKAEEWARFTELCEYLRLPILVADATARMYRTAADSGFVSEHFVDTPSLSDCRAILDTGKPLFESIFDIPRYVEAERQRISEENARQARQEAERIRAERQAREAETRKRKRAALAEELGINLERLSNEAPIPK